MERIKMDKNSKKHDFRAGDEFLVKRTIMGEVVVIRQTAKPNIIMSERKARYYGKLTGTPQLG